MPVTISIVDHQATEWTSRKSTTSEGLLEAVSRRHYRNCERLVQSSFTRSDLRTGHITSSRNGFVWTAYHAYSQHHHLVIRPDDIWFAILTQMSFFVNANAESLRTFFVAHQGRKELEAISSVADFGALAVQMTKLIAKNVKDPELREWVMPSFTTTTSDDKVVGAIIFMGAMQKYFSYGFRMTCGLPSITLLGELGDWKEVLLRLDKLELLGEEPRQFASMLRPILQHMVLSFENPTSTEVNRFWDTIVHRNSSGSGDSYLSGWLTAFCFWDEDGVAKLRSTRNNQFGGIQFPTVKTREIPAGFASVPVTVDDNGDAYPATMVAGSVGIAASISGDLSNRNIAIPTASSVLSESSEVQHIAAQTPSEESSSVIVRDIVQPVSGWWLYEDKASRQGAQRRAEERRLEYGRSNPLNEGVTASSHWVDRSGNRLSWLIERMV